MHVQLTGSAYNTVHSERDDVIVYAFGKTKNLGGGEIVHMIRKHMSVRFQITIWSFNVTLGYGVREPWRDLGS